MSKAKCPLIARQRSQEHGDCTLSTIKTANHNSREYNSRNEKSRELFSIENPLSSYRTATERRKSEKTPYVDAVFEAYGILPVEGYFSRDERKAVDLSAEWSTVPAEVKSIIVGFLA